VYDNLLEIILEINLLTKIYNVTKLGFLYDTAMSSRHTALENPSTGNLVKFTYLILAEKNFFNVHTTSDIISVCMHATFIDNSVADGASRTNLSKANTLYIHRHT
jgi:1,2-phenylacetyl-CoA epoxidase catalytic subunit